MVRPSSSVLKNLPPLPEGYALRQLCGNDERQYEELFHLAFEDEGRFPETYDRALDGGFFVVEHLSSAHLVASCVALRGSSSPRHPDAGQLGWLVTDPAHTRKGLGTIVAASVTNRLLTEGYAQPFLGTEDSRMAAISIYVKLGWRPFVYGSDTESRWRSIFARLGRQFESSPLHSK
jgi:mycothiol synthase